MSMSEPQSLPATGPGVVKVRHPAREPQNSASDITIGSMWHGRLHGNADRRPTVLSEPYADAHGSMRVRTRIGNRVLNPLLNSFLSDYALDRAPVIVADPDPSEPAIVAPPAEPAAPAHPVTIDVSGEAPVLHESHGVVVGQVRTAAAFDARNGTVSRIIVEPGDAKTFTARGIWPSHVPSRGWSVSLPAHEIATRWPKVEAPPFPTVSDPIVSKSATFLPFSAFSAPATPRNADAWFGQDLCKADLTAYLMDRPGADAEKVLARMLWLGHHRATTDLAFAEMVRDGQAGMFTSDGNVCWTLLTPRALAPAPVADPAPPTPAQEDEALLALLDGYTARKIREAATHAANDIRTLYGVTPATLRPRDVIRALVVRGLGAWSGAGLVK